MSTRKIKDAKDRNTNELIYFKGHAQATFMSDGTTVEDAINSIETGDIDLSEYTKKDEVYEILMNNDIVLDDSDITDICDTEVNS